MKTLLRLTLGLLALAMLRLAGSPAPAATAPGPYYATPSWDQTLPAATRFIVLSNFNSEGVLDRETGLVWERSPDTTLRTWTRAENQLSARLHCINRNIGGRSGFRLPSINELASLIDRSVAFPGPTLPAGHPFTNVPSTSSSRYWSVATVADVPSNAWFVDFGFGVVDDANKGGTLFVWCVRGGGPLDTY